MNKKQILNQNTSLFAELERKNIEIKALEIKLDDAEKAFDKKEKDYFDICEKYKTLSEENKSLLTEKESLNAKINILKAEIENLKATEDNSDLNIEKNCVETEESSPTSKQINKPVLTHDDTEDLPYESDTNVLNDVMLTYEQLKEIVVKAIGEVTKAAAVALAEVKENENASTAKSLVMGKNESFKIEALSFLSGNTLSKNGAETIIKKAEEAAEYIKNVNGLF